MAVRPRRAYHLAAGEGIDGASPSSMPGPLVAVLVEAGQPMAKGERMLVLQATKMEQASVAPFDANDMAMIVRLARSGVSLSFGMEETFRPYIERGELVAVLERFLPTFPGFFLFFPRRQHQQAKLRALIDHFRTASR